LVFKLKGVENVNKKWLFSIIVTLVIWGAGAAGYFYISKNVPNELQEASAIAVSSPSEEAEQSEQERELKDVIYDVQKAVVMIQIPETGSAGSGFIYNNKGDILTNAHVVSGSEHVKVKMTDMREFDGKVIGISTETDIAVVRVAALEGEEPLAMHLKDYADLGDKVLALGSPLGLQNTVTSGMISGVDRDFDLGPYKYEDAYQISAPIAPGNSGGPLVIEETGEVIGINSAGTDQGTIGFSIPILNVMSLVESWSASPMASLPAAAEMDQYASEMSATSLEEMGYYLVSYFYESLNYGDYVTAYALLGSKWQSGTSYEQFRNGYLNTKSVTVDDIQTTTNREEVTLLAVISAYEKVESGERYRKYKLMYQVGYENGQVKILSGKGEVIE
jgi:serine protease Do